MKEAITKHLRKKDLDACLSQLGDIDASVAQPINLADRQAVHALHGEDGGGAIIPHHLRHPEYLASFSPWCEITSQLTTVRRLAQQIEFVM